MNRHTVTNSYLGEYVVDISATTPMEVEDFQPLQIFHLFCVGLVILCGGETQHACVDIFFLACFVNTCLEVGDICY